MTPVLHVSREVADALRAGLSIAPVEGLLVCPCFGQPCTSCGGRGVVPPVLPGRIAVAVDGAIIGTATASEVLPVVDGIDPSRSSRYVTIDDGRVSLRWRSDGEAWDRDDLGPNALGLSPGQWVVTIEDWAPTTDRCPGCWGIGQGEAVYLLSIEVGGLDYLPCDACDGEESCPPVPVAAAPVGTITTWEAT